MWINEVVNKHVKKQRKDQIKSIRRSYSLDPNLPENVLQAFEKLADDQRGIPERIMVYIQNLTQGNILNDAIEHIGDLTNRMTSNIRHNYLQTNEVYRKTLLGLRRLTSGYGFEREMLEQLRQTSLRTYQDYTRFRENIYLALDKYAQAHSQLKVYNYPQWLAREAAVALGRRNWKRAINCLKILKHMIEIGLFETAARSYKTDSSGNIMEFRK